jgi:hypothetical protein
MKNLYVNKQKKTVNKLTKEIEYLFEPTYLLIDGAEDLLVT